MKYVRWSIEGMVIGYCMSFLIALAGEPYNRMAWEFLL